MKKKTVFTGADIEAMFKAGKSAADIPAGAVLTPSAKEALRDAGAVRPSAAAPAVSSEPILPDYEYHWTPGKDPKTPAEIEAFFHSPAIVQLKERMVDIGKRMWAREYTDGNGGNLTIRVGDNLVLCTPTLVSKGFMTVEQMCLVDLDGKQLAGKFKRTSECMTHLAIMKRQPKAKACCHAHPPHGTAFAVAGVQPPTCMIPEAEVFLGQIGLAEYQTPGTPANAEVVGNAAVDHMAVLMVNHGVITWGKDIEDSYWKMENVEAYCKTVWVASQLNGGNLLTITGGQAKELIALRKTLGMDDKRANWKECQLCDNADFHPGTVCRVPGDAGAPAPSAKLDPEAEKLVQQLTDQILASMK
ncbi:MAG: class II aldolase/adducin family protein [Akkermansiaceae bacterium]|nr:class II aldolase/adducin family protein [Akkermansiaceae bacterium]MCP5543814.1 class II aldolase/adducin family protein [Akkermansiaceae bacterium]MCP5546516.1 class II aldolase/adducin family protein [Akkermansiaceae bacterium]